MLLIPQALATRVELSVCVLAAMCKQVHLLPLLTLSVAPPSSPPPLVYMQNALCGTLFPRLNEQDKGTTYVHRQSGDPYGNDKDSFDSLLCVKNGFFRSDLAVLADHTD